MNVHCIRIKLFAFASWLVVLLICNLAAAQQLQYSRPGVFIDNPEYLQLVTNVSGRHHLLSCSGKENIAIFIFNPDLRFKNKIATPIKLPENAQLNIIAFAHFYYLSIYSRPAKKYTFWKVDADGNSTDYTLAFEKLLQTQMQHMESGFQVTERKGQLCILYHTYIPNLEKNVLTMVMADSLLNVAHTKKLMYEFKQGSEKLLQEQFISDKYLLVLKTTTGGTALKLMKVDIATGLAVSNEFFSSGYYFSQSLFHCNNEDSTITVSSLLVEPYNEYRQKNYVFVSRLNSILVEQIPFTLLKTQFRKNTGTNFLLPDKQAGWVRLYTRKSGPYFNGAFVDYSEAQRQSIRFSMLDKNLKLSSDSLVRNNRNSYTLKAAQFARFSINNRDYLLLAQEFYSRSKSILMIAAGEQDRLSYKHLPVVDGYDYLMDKASVIPQQGIIIPYLNKREAGLLKIVMK